MLRLVSALACLGVLQAARIASVPHLVVPPPPQPQLHAVLEQKKADEPATIVLPLTKVEADVSSFQL